LIIAIDGPAASGKGTLAKRLAAAFGLPHLDTGLLYRATAAAVLEAGHDISDEAAAVRAATGLDPRRFDDARLRGKDMGEAASVVAAWPAVRAALIEIQRAFARQPSGAVLDGRDIGTVICPDADAKIFVVASAEARAQRRLREFESRGEAVDAASVLADIRRRDERDSGRASAPLRPAADAEILDTTSLDVEAAFAAAREIVTRRLAAARERWKIAR
jgi:cytidylate kinase